MNTFELKIIDSDEIPFALTTKPPGVITQQIWIDGAHLDEPHVVDIRELVSSIFRPGEFYFFTCECGEPGCAGIWDGFKVRHLPEEIQWHFRRPVRQPDNDLAEEDDFHHWTSTTAAIDYKFDRQQFTYAMNHALEVLKSKQENSEYSPYGFDRKQLDSLDAYHPPLNWEEKPGRRKLYFLVDEASQLFMDGQFVTLNQLGTSELFASMFRTWESQQKLTATLNTNQRLEWLESTRSLALSAYTEGLSDDIDIWIVAYQWTANDQLDPWDAASRLVSRQFLNIQSPFDDPFLCLSADKGSYCLWFDYTPDTKNQRYRFVSSGRNVYDSSPFLIPFALEKELLDWASRMPEYRKPGPWDRWLLGRPIPSDQMANFDWSRFHTTGQYLASEIKKIVGNRATVLYELPWESPSLGDSRRIEIKE